MEQDLTRFVCKIFSKNIVLLCSLLMLAAISGGGTFVVFSVYIFYLYIALLVSTVITRLEI